MSDKGNNAKYFVRIFIGLTMAVLGSVIIDQLVLKGDIEKKKMFLQSAQVDSITNKTSKEIRKQLSQIDSSIVNKEAKRVALLQEIARQPVFKYSVTKSDPMQVTRTTVDSTNQKVTDTKVIQAKSTSVNTVENPKKLLLGTLNKELDTLNNQKAAKNNSLLTLRAKTENDLKSKEGFLDDLNTMWLILTTSKLALSVWLLWAFLLLGLESLTLIIKALSGETDYDKTIEHQMALQNRKLELLAKNYHQ